MSIAGLSKLGLIAPPAAQKSQGKVAPSTKDPVSFEETLGQVQTDSKPAARPQEKNVREEKSARAQGSQKNTEPQSLPSTPNAPILDSPAVGDRFMQAPNELPAVHPLNKPQIAAVQPEDQSVDPLTRRAVWNDFLRKMKDELGVSAEDVLGAFDSLSAEELAKPPAQTVDKVVMALGLNDAQTQVAKQYFMDLINRTQPKSLGDELAKSENQISLTLMSQRELDRKATGKAIDNLNQNFFMKGPYERPMAPMAAQPHTQTQGHTQNQAAFLAQGQAQQNSQAQVAPNENEFMAQSPQPQGEAIPFVPSLDPATRATQMQAAASAANGAKLAIPKDFASAASDAKPVKADVDSILKKFTEGQGQSAQLLQAGTESFAASAMPQAPAAAMASEAVPAATKAGGEAMAAMQAIFAGGPSKVQNQSEFADDQEFTSDASYLGATLGADGQSRAQNLQPGEFQSQLTSAAGPGQPVAVPDLVKNAQVMVTEGGGEMKVTLTPEGLGEVAMKVSVKDGKVNVQMITESDEAKRMIERTLGDLKSSLATSNLLVNDIKIDTASNLGKQLEQQYNDAQRQMAQQTLEQFRQDHQGWRRSYFEVPGARQYKSQADAPRDAQAPTSVSAKRGGGRLNLVA